jgi:hypothetical protein
MMIITVVLQSVLHAFKMNEEKSVCARAVHTSTWVGMFCVFRYYAVAADAVTFASTAAAAALTIAVL